MKKLREFLNNSENDFLTRILLIIVGLILGTLFISLSTVVNNDAATTAFQVFGYTAFFSFLVCSGIWWLVDNG